MRESGRTEGGVICIQKVAEGTRLDKPAEALVSAGRVLLQHEGQVRDRHSRDNRLHQGNVTADQLLSDVQGRRRVGACDLATSVRCLISLLHELL